MSKVLFVCLHNAGRSQMSEALFLREAGGRHEARSAGTTPGDRVHDTVVTVMREKGIDLSDRKPRLLTTELAQWTDLVITMGCGDACPVIPCKRYIDWDLLDPKDLPIDEVRKIRDDISKRVIELVESLSHVDGLKFTVGDRWSPQVKSMDHARHRGMNEGSPATQTFQLTKEQRWQPRSWT